MSPVEHRIEPRISTTVTIRLLVAKHYTVPVRIRNVSNHGLFVETDTPVPRNALVQVEVPSGSADQPPTRFRAYVVHTTDRGAGLMLASEDELCVRALCKLIRQAARGGIRWRPTMAHAG